MNRHRRNLLLAAALYALTAVVRLPLEQKISTDLRREDLLPPRVEAGLRDQVGQGALLAVLGGMRSAVASMTELQAFTGFCADPPQWQSVDRYYEICTQLQPKEYHYWEFHSWMLASNAAEYFATGGGAPKGMEQDMRQFYRQRGLEIALRGIKNLPDDWHLYRQAAMILSSPMKEINPHPDHLQAAERRLQE